MSSFPSSSVWLSQGSSRQAINSDELAKLQSTQTVVTDDRRRRTRWFDGRFFAAKDQIREQDYMLTRFADLGRAAGLGVISGLMVSHSGQAMIAIAPGQGITASGEQVLVPAPVAIDLSQIENIELLDAAFGLGRLPRDPATNRSGLFIIGLRPVEYTANPIASYPTTVNGPRGVQDGDIIEASAIVLVPFPDEGSTAELLQRRSRVARRIFVENGSLGVPENVLPLAMIAMERGVIQWLDVFLVRREVGMEHGSIIGLGFAPRALREAHMLQYMSQLSEIVTGRGNSNRGQNFAGADYFDVLPPAGMMPAAAINAADFSQTYFPSQVQCDLSIVPDDELVALIEESLLLPPVDLKAAPEDLESTSVLIVVPMPRTEIPNFKAKLTTLLRPLRSPAPGIVFQRKPIQSLIALTSIRFLPPVLNVENPIDAAWKQALARNSLLWYVRRRNIQIRADVTGVLPPADAVTRIWALSDNLATLGLNDRFNKLRQKTTPAGVVEITSLLSGPAFLHSLMLMEGAIHELEQAGTLDKAAIERIVGRFSDPALGLGLARITRLVPGILPPDPNIHTARIAPNVIAGLGIAPEGLPLIPSVVDAAITLAIADSGAVPEFDLLGRVLLDPDLVSLGNQVIALAKASGDIGALLRVRPEVAKLEQPQ